MSLPPWQEEVGWEGLELGKRPFGCVRPDVFLCPNCSVTVVPSWPSTRGPAVEIRQNAYWEET